MRDLLSFSKITALLLATCLSSTPALAAQKTNTGVEQEALKAKAAVWRETGNAEEGKLTFQKVFPDKAWWERFQDPYLSGYIQQAVNANLNLAAAHERIQEARSLARQSLGTEFPQVSLGASFSRSRSSATVFRVPRTGAAGATTGGGGFALGQYINNFSLPLSVSYEADIWQKNRDSTRSVNKEAEAVERDFQTTHVIVVTDVANAYFNLLAADELIALQKELIQTAESDLAHAQRRFEAGLVDEEDVVLRQGRLTTFKALMQEYIQAQALALNQLAVLMGQTPQQVAELPRASWQQYTIPTEVEAGIPSELLVRRPDILAAEDRLEAAGLRVSVARKEMLPSINLSGQFGFASARLGSLFDWQSYIASATESLLQPIFTGGQRRANLRVMKARYEQQLLAYRDTILQSFREVDDSLASLKAHRNSYEEYSASLASLKQRLKIQQNRLAAGAISEVEINPVQIEITQAAEGLTRTKLLALTDTLSLYKALGGGY